MGKTLLKFGTVQTPYGEMQAVYDVTWHTFHVGAEYGEHVTVLKQDLLVSTSASINGDIPGERISVNVRTNVKVLRTDDMEDVGPALRKRVTSAMTSVIKAVVDEHRDEASRASWQRELVSWTKFRDKHQVHVDNAIEAIAKIEAELAAIPE